MGFTVRIVAVAVMDDPLRVDHEQLEAFANDVLSVVGVTDPHAQRVATTLVYADRCGVDSHGVARLPVYVENFEAGGFNCDPEITIDRVSDSGLLVDADDGPGQSASIDAMDRAMEVAAETGLAGAAVRRSNHFGAARYFTERASEHGFIGIATSNVDSTVIPYGGTEPVLGTNPISIAVPTDREFDIVLDMATSVAAFGKIDHATEEGESIPPEWAVDESGEPTTDPEAVAALRPMSGPKGYALGLVIDVLSGLLSGAGPSTSVGELYDDYADPMRLGHFVGTIDVSAFRDYEAFIADVDDLITRLKSQRPQDGVDEVMLPGEIETNTRRRTLDAGVPIRPEVYGDLETLGDEYGVVVPDQLSD